MITSFRLLCICSFLPFRNRFIFSLHPFLSPVLRTLLPSYLPFGVWNCSLIEPSSSIVKCSKPLTQSWSVAIQPRIGRCELTVHQGGVGGMFLNGWECWLICCGRSGTLWQRRNQSSWFSWILFFFSIVEGNPVVLLANEQEINLTETFS